MQKIEEFVDERQKSWCIHCGQWIAEIDTNEDHVPSKSLLQKPHPHHLPVIRVCKSCNSGFSLDEQYLVAFISSVLAGSTEPSAQPNASAKRSLAQSCKLRERIERSKTTYQTRGGKTRHVWKPEWQRVSRVILKNARGHAFFEFGEPMLDEPEHIRAVPIASLTKEQRDNFEDREPTLEAWPEVGSRMMTRVLTGQDLEGPWIIVQEGVYRYSVAQRGGMLVRSVLSEYLATEVFWGG